MIFRGFLYWLGRILGDLKAISRGPKAVNRRVKRRIAGKILGQLLRKL